MESDTTTVDEVVLALLHLNAHTDHGMTRAWKGFDWDAMDPGWPRPCNRRLAGDVRGGAR
jgi:hypothetical protein